MAIAQVTSPYIIGLVYGRGPVVINFPHVGNSTLGQLLHGWFYKFASRLGCRLILQNSRQSAHTVRAAASHDGVIGGTCELLFNILIAELRPESFPTDFRNAQDASVAWYKACRFCLLLWDHSCGFVEEQAVLPKYLRQLRRHMKGIRAETFLN